MEVHPQQADPIDDADSTETPDGNGQLAVRKSHKSIQSFPSSPLALFLGAALCTGVLAYRRLTRGRRSKAALKRRLFREIDLLALRNSIKPSTSVKQGGLLPLHNLSFVVSDRFDIFGWQTRFGCDEWQSQNPVCESSAPLVERIVALGGNLLATVPALPLGITLGIAGQAIGSNDDGALVSVSSHLADASLTVDEAGRTVIGAACHGLYSYRPTANASSLDGISYRTATLSVPSIVARDGDALRTIASALGMCDQMGGSSLTSVSNYLIAEDLFSVCGEQVKQSIPVVIEAVKRWAGVDNAQALSLCDWLYHRMPLLRKFMDGSTLDEGTTTSHASEQSIRCRAVLRALVSVARVIRNWEWVNTSASGRWIAQGGLQYLKSDASKEEWNTAVNATSKDEYEAALQVVDELSSGIRAALQDGYVFVMPTVPASAVSPGFDFFVQAEELCVLAPLAGVPLVTIPFGQSLSISLLSLQRQDHTLLKAATKLGPMLEEIARDLQRPHSPRRALKDRAAPNGSRQDPSLNDHVNEADVAKEAGNVAFKAGKYEEAVTWYAEAIKKNPSTAVYYSNRAMALLMCGRYGAAEADCDAAIKLNPTMVKAYLRRGSSRLALGNLIEAKDDFERVLVLEPRNRQAIEELKRLENAVGNVIDDSALFTSR